MTIWNRARLRQRQGVRRLTRVGEVWVRVDNGQPEIMRPSVRYKFPGVDETCRECGYHEHKQGCSKYACPRCRGFANTHASWCELGPKDQTNLAPGASGAQGPSGCPQGMSGVAVDRGHHGSVPAEQPKGKPCPTCGYQWLMSDGNAGGTLDCSLPQCVRLLSDSHRAHRDAWKASSALPGWQRIPRQGLLGYTLSERFERLDRRAIVFLRGEGWSVSGVVETSETGWDCSVGWGLMGIATAREAMRYADEQLRLEDERVAYTQRTGHRL